jgi:hypothetical protein
MKFSQFEASNPQKMKLKHFYLYFKSQECIFSSMGDLFEYFAQIMDVE